MFTKLKLFLELFKYGNQVREKSFWLKAQHVVVPVLVGLLVSCNQLAQAYGVSLPIDYDTCNYIAGALYFIVNSVLAIITNKRLGLPTGEGSEAKPTVQGTEQPSEALPNASNVQPESVPASESRFGDDTLARAAEWLKRNVSTDAKGNHVEQNPFNRGD